MKRVNQLDVAPEIEKKIGEKERLRVRLVFVNYYYTIILTVTRLCIMFIAN